MLRSFERAARRNNMIAIVPTPQADKPMKKRCTQEMVARISERLEKQYQAFRNGMDYREDDKL